MEVFLFYMLIVSGTLLLISAALHVLELFITKPALKKIAVYCTLISFLCVLAMIIGRTAVGHRIPLSNMFEFGLFFFWSIIAVYLYIHFKYKLSSLGIIVLPFLVLMNFWLLWLDKGIKPLMPVLNSNWLYFHVFTAIAAYGCFMVSFAVAVLYLIKEYSKNKLTENLPALNTLDDLTYKIICIGMPFLTLCIVTGAFWAENAWGSYWSWDPKETWSLITWLVYAVYLHVRLVAGWRGKRAACLAVIGFLAVLFTFFGVNLLLPGLHSYR